MTQSHDLQEQPSRYVVGIDLGTTNSAMASVDSTAEPWSVETFAVPQLVAGAVVEARETLPSFHYQAAEGEFAPGALRLPWRSREDEFFVGTFAQTHGETAPGRLITSAKSWLCHAGVDRTADLLPWHGAADVARISPVMASSRYLSHLRAAWNHRFPRDPLEQQEVVLTLPASFDEVARELTIKAAHLAGLPRVVLVEEPQAAFYAWIHAQREDWESRVQPGQKILVCDIGGGTSDFTLIRVRRGADGRVQFHRVAVGDHLILGGDNLDLALAHHLETRLPNSGAALSPRQWGMLVQTARRVKETLLAADAPPRMTVHLAGGGSKLIGGALQLEVTAEEARQVLVEGFLPPVSLEAKPIARRSGFQEFGLPYASDAAITRYLAAFLTAHRHAGDEVLGQTQGQHDPARPDIVLFNGGFFAAPVLQKRLLEVLSSWFASASSTEWSPLVLANERLDLAVAHGAAYYGMVRRGQGTRIAAGLARTYYIGAETSLEGASTEAMPSAVCLVPAGAEEGENIDLDSPQFHLRIREPVEFPLYASSTRLTDPPGAVVPFDPEQMTSLPPIRTVLTAGKKGAPAESLSVTLHGRLTEIGTIELWCKEAQGARTWKLDFDVRSATQTDRAGHAGRGEQAGFVDESLSAACRELIAQTFASPASTAPPPEGLVKRLEQATDMRRAAWPPSLLRALWEALWEAEGGRRRSAEHEARWLYLTGYGLRPGYGLAVDDWRVAQTWRLLQGKLLHGTPTCRVEWFLLWRRIAGGLSSGQQRALTEPLVANLPALYGIKGNRKGVGSGAHELCEVLRLLGSCEWLPPEMKVTLGDGLVARASREKTQAVLEAQLWTLARLGARVSMYGPLNTTVAAEQAERWIEALLALRDAPASLSFTLMQLARRTDDRYRDVAPTLRRDVLDRLIARNAPAHLIELVREGGQLEEEEQGQLFGEALPRGLRIL